MFRVLLILYPASFILSGEKNAIAVRKKRKKKAIRNDYTLSLNSRKMSMRRRHTAKKVRQEKGKVYIMSIRKETEKNYCHFLLQSYKKEKSCAIIYKSLPYSIRME